MNNRFIYITKVDNVSNFINIDDDISVGVLHFNVIIGNFIFIGQPGDEKLYWYRYYYSKSWISCIKYTNVLEKGGLKHKSRYKWGGFTAKLPALVSWKSWFCIKCKEKIFAKK